MLLLVVVVVVLLLVLVLLVLWVALLLIAESGSNGLVREVDDGKLGVMPSKCCFRAPTTRRTRTTSTVSTGSKWEGHRSNRIRSQDHDTYEQMSPQC